VGGVAFPSLRCSCLLSQWRLNGEKHCDIFWLRGAFFIFVFSQLPLPSDANSNSGEGMTKGGCVGHGEGGGDSISGASCGKCKIMRKGFVCIN